MRLFDKSSSCLQWQLHQLQNKLYRNWSKKDLLNQVIAVIIKIQMGQTSNSHAHSNGQYIILRQTPNGSIVKEVNTNRLHFVKQYSFTNQQAYQQAFVNFSKKLPQKHQHILYLQRTNTKLENTFCSTFYKISLLYEYFQHTLQREIQQRNQQRKVFDQKQIWSVLCSCTLGVSEMIRLDGRSHAALSAKDIRLNEEGLVKVLSVQMVGMDNDHDVNRQGTTKQLAVTILNCLLMQQITNDSQDFLLDVIQNLESTSQMKKILKLMINTSTQFTQLEQYLFKMVQEETDSINSYSNTPVLKEKPRQANSYSKINQESKQDDSLMNMTKDTEDYVDICHQQLTASQEQVPDDNDDQSQKSKNESHQQSLKQNQRGLTSPRKNIFLSPNSSNFKFVTNQQNSLFTDPKLLNLISSDLQQIKKRKSVKGSRKLGTSQSHQFLQQKTQSEDPNNIRSHMPNILGEIKNNQSKMLQTSQSDLQINYFKLVSLGCTNIFTNISSIKPQIDQSNSDIKINNNKVMKNQPTSQNCIETEKLMNNPKCKINSSKDLSVNLQKLIIQKRCQNIMETQDMGFKKNKGKPKEEIRQEIKEVKKEESRVSFNLQTSNVSNTVAYNSRASSSYNSNGQKFNSFRSQKQRSSQNLIKGNSQIKESKVQLEYVTETYIRGRYEGTKLNNMRHGKGVFYYNEGGKYIGQWRQNKMYGKGVLYYPNNEIAYDGEWKEDQLWGRGTLYNEEPTQLNTPIDYRNWDQADQYWIKYEGQFSLDCKNGEGKLYLSNGQIFEGRFKDDMVWGDGILLRRDGTRLKGIWRQNKLVRIY